MSLYCYDDGGTTTIGGGYGSSGISEAAAAGGNLCRFVHKNLKSVASIDAADGRVCPSMESAPKSCRRKDMIFAPKSACYNLRAKILSVALLEVEKPARHNHAQISRHRHVRKINASYVTVRSLIELLK